MPDGNFIDTLPKGISPEELKDKNMFIAGYLFAAAYPPDVNTKIGDLRLEASMAYDFVVANKLIHG